MTQQVVNTGIVAGDSTGSRGQVPWNAFNTNSTELYKNAFFYGLDTGIVNAPVITLANLLPEPAGPLVPNAATILRFVPGFVNTGSATLAFAGNAPTAILKSSGASLTGGELNGLTILEFTGAAWQIVGPTQASIGALLYPQTPAEIAAGVTPVNFAFQAGDFRRYGGDGTGSADSTTAINTAVSVVQQSFALEGLNFKTTGNHAPVAGSSVVGPGLLTLSGGTNAMFALTASNVFINRLQMNCSANSSGSKTGVSIGGSASNVEVSDCTLTQARILTVGTNSFIKIVRNTTTGSCVGGISGGTISIANGGTCTNFNVSDNNCSTSDGSGIAVFNNASYGNISRNQCVSNTGFGILLQSGAEMMVAENVCASNLQPGFGIQPAGVGAITQRSTIIGNVARLNGFDGFDINCAASGQAFAYLEVIGNYSESNGTNVNGGTGFNIEGCSLSAFVGNMAFANNTYGYNIQGGTLNTFTGNLAVANSTGISGSSAGFFLNGATFCQLVGNTSTNTSGGATQPFGIQESGSSDNNYFSGNILTNNINGPITTVGAHSIFEPQQITAAPQALSSTNTITNAGFRILRVTAAAAVTGIILPVGSYYGQQVTVINESIAANTVTMAASGTSNVADGVSCVIAGLTQKTFYWDNGTSLWYHS
jgi:parallel beta-helix repeat protein